MDSENPTQQTERSQRIGLALGWLILGVLIALGYFWISMLPYTGLLLLFVGVLRLRKVTEPRWRVVWYAYAFAGGLLMIAAFVLVLALNQPG